jgi:hypothetical protein
MGIRMAVSSGKMMAHFWFSYVCVVKAFNLTASLKYEKSWFAKSELV